MQQKIFGSSPDRDGNTFKRDIFIKREGYFIKRLCSGQSMVELAVGAIHPFPPY